MKQIKNSKMATKGMPFYAVALVIISGIIFSAFQWSDVLNPTIELGEEQHSDDVLPMFNEQDLLKYLKSNIEYPRRAKVQRVQGKVILSFRVDKNGDVSDMTVVKGIGHGCDREAIRVVMEYPNWTQPKAERVKVVLPISFKLRR